jgi:hypothetical protein
LFLFTCAGMLSLYMIALWWGALNQDEGWYLYAGRLVHEGQIPYRDFVTTQGPVMAYFYALSYPLVEQGGLLAGRMLTACLGVFTVFLSMMLARQIAKRQAVPVFWPMLLTVAFCGLNLYQVYFTSIVKTYALTAVFMLSGLMFFARSLHHADRDHSKRLASLFVYAFLAGLFLALAAGTRLSAAFLLPACWVPTCVRWWRANRPKAITCSLAGLLCGGTVGMLAVFGPFLLIAYENVHFGLLEYHAARSVEGGMQRLSYKTGFILRSMQAYWPLWVAAVLIPLGIFGRRDSSPGSAQERSRFPLPLWTSFILVSVIHMLSAFPYDDYQVFVMPLVCVAVALRAGRLLAVWDVSSRIRVCWVGAALILLLGHSLSAPMLQSWLLGPRDRIWWPFRAESSLAQLRRVGRMIRGDTSRGGNNNIMLTQDTYVAVESGYRVPEGMEMGPFSNFLAVSDEQAAALQVLNRNLLRQTLATTPADWAVYSGYGFSIQAPQVIPIPEDERQQFLQILQNRFTRYSTEPYFGQAMTTLYIDKKEMP